MQRKHKHFASLAVNSVFYYFLIGDSKQGAAENLLSNMYRNTLY